MQILPVLILSIVLIRIFGKVVIVEVPTPYSSHLKHEVISSGFFRNVSNYLIYLIFAPLAYILPNRVIFYAYENGWLSKLSSNLKLYGNGIDVKAIKMKSSSNKIDGSLSLVGVATIARWHGWEIVLNVISELKIEGYRILFHLVGDGPEKNNLQNLAERLKIQDQVIFHGMLNSNQLENIYENSQLGVGTLDWNSIGVSEASPLKYREYLSAGLPFFYDTFDPDFSETNLVSFRVKGKQNEIKKLLKDIMKKNNLPTPSYCRTFAEEKLDFSEKNKLIFYDFI